MKTVKNIEKPRKTIKNMWKLWKKVKHFDKLSMANKRKWKVHMQNPALCWRGYGPNRWPTIGGREIGEFRRGEWGVPRTPQWCLPPSYRLRDTLSAPGRRRNETCLRSTLWHRAQSQSSAMHTFSQSTFTLSLSPTFPTLSQSILLTFFPSPSF